MIEQSIYKTIPGVMDGWNIEGVANPGAEWTIEYSHKHGNTTYESPSWGCTLWQLPHFEGQAFHPRAPMWGSGPCDTYEDALQVAVNNGALI